MENKLCIGCGNNFKVKRWWQRACSRKCWQRIYREQGTLNSHLTKVSPMKGKYQSKEARLKISEALRGENAPQWKGENATYISKHWWNIKWLGQPDTCEHCGKNGLKGRQIHWANKSGKYLRDITDWLRLCVKCHTVYDKR